MVNDIYNKEIVHSKLDKLKFGAKISALMSEKGFTDDTFSYASGISVAMIREIRYGRRLPSLEKYLWIIETLGVSDLLPLSDSLNIEYQNLAKNDRIVHEISILTEDMSPEQLALFIEGVKTLKKALSNKNNGKGKYNEVALSRSKK